MSATKKVLPVLFSMVLLDQMASWMLLPVLPLLFVEPSSAYFLLKDPAQAQSIGYILLGLVFGAFPLMQFFAGPVLGEVSDKYGRKPVLVLAALSIAAGYMILVGAVLLRSLPALFIARILSGIGGGSLGVIFASAADISSESTRAKNFGIVAAAAGLGLILGPLAGGVLSDGSLNSHFSLLIPLYVLILLALCNVVIVAFYFPETLIRLDPTRVIEWGKSLLYIRQAYVTRQLRGIFLVSFLFSASLALFITFGPVLMYGRFGLSESYLSYFLGYFGLSVIVAQGGLITRLLRIAPEEVVLRDSLLGIFVGLWILYFASSWPWLLLATPIIAMCVAFCYTMIASLLSLRTVSGRQGEILGINTSVQALGFAIPGIFSGLLAARLSADATIAAAGVCILCAAVFVFISPELKPTTKSEGMR
jgi:DHA1 family tetracycline resistance protein-like MFS transporter